MFENFGSLDTLVEQKIEADVDFQNSLADLSDEDKDNALKQKKSELLDAEIATLNERATEAEKAKELADNYKKRSERAEGELKKIKPTEDKTDGDLSQKDLIALMKADVHEDDIDEVVEYAKLKKISVSEAMKTSVVKTILSEKIEQRKTAEATNIGKGKRVTNKITDNTLLENASKGDFPEKGSEEAERLFEARRAAERGR